MVETIDCMVSQASSSDEGSSTADSDSFNTPLSVEPDVPNENVALLHNATPTRNGANVFQTSLNIGKMCMGPGTLALPFAAEKGGLLFNVGGLVLIGLWNYYSANCLLRCLEHLPRDDKIELEERSLTELEQQSVYGTTDSNFGVNNQPKKTDSSARIDSMPPPPEGTTTYGVVAWYASGSKGLVVLDLLMILLFFGILIAYEVAMQSFINDTPLTTGSKSIDLLIPSIIVGALSCAPDLGFLSKFSGMGLLAVVLSFVVISLQGFQENGCSGFRNGFQLNLWPESLSGASSWFGVVVFSFGFVPLIFNIRDSMAKPMQVGLALQIGAVLVSFGYIIMSNGIRVLFSPSHVFHGDALQVMPNNWGALVVRLLMTFSVSVSAPLLVLPCGELIEGKLGIGGTQHSLHRRIFVRLTICAICTIISAFLGSGFANVVSFIGCFCVAIVSFVMPPLFCIQLSIKRKPVSRENLFALDSLLLYDAGVLMIGIIATVITSSLTFRELMARASVY
mmetsp:Transcript_37386/g.78849  ORF Transcript_37386/g.78849 Transcript_37386/m.78849 type:complete len:508 (+) Transcript_37386:95-1618(+)